MKKTILTIIFFSISAVLSAHEFWLQPEKYLYARGEAINIKFLVGEGFEGENWTGNRERVKSLHMYFGNAVDKNMHTALSKVKGDSIQFSIFDEGTAMVTYQSNNTFVELGAREFNAYLREDGLTEAIEYREQQGDTTKDGKEFYQRSVKTIFQVGKKTDDTYRRLTDLPIDIIPDNNPYTVSSDGDFKVRIRFKGEPLKNTRIKVWHRVGVKVSQIDYTTDDEGEVKIFFSPTGQWMVSAVKMERLEKDHKAEWQSYWGSLTWGYY